jgi:hypothetical protein
MSDVVHALQTIADTGSTPVNAPPALRVGKLNYVPAMLETFAHEGEGANKVDLLIDLQILTPAEFKDLCKNSIKAAAKVDTLNGFVPADDAKGQDKYGSKESSMRTQASMASVVWGAMKQGDAYPNGSFAGAVKQARKFLDSIARKWDGSVALTKDQKTAKAALDLEAQAYALAKAADPAAKLDDLAELVESKRAELVNTAIDEAAAKLLKAWEKLDPAVLARAIELYTVAE